MYVLPCLVVVSLAGDAFSALMGILICGRDFLWFRILVIIGLWRIGITPVSRMVIQCSSIAVLGEHSPELHG
jgi:hypothetical protein